MAQVEVQVPDIGDFSEVTVIELMVAVGDTILISERNTGIRKPDGDGIPHYYKGRIGSNLSVAICDSVA